RQETRNKISTVIRAHLALDRLQRFKYTRRVGREIVGCEIVRDVLERTSHIGRYHVEYLCGWRSVKLYLETAVEEDRRDVRRSHQILKIGIYPSDLVDLAFQL